MVVVTQLAQLFRESLRVSGHLRELLPRPVVVGSLGLFDGKNEPVQLFDGRLGF
jgi:hypothetical protein